MHDEITIDTLTQFISATVQFLRAKLSRDDTSRPVRAGWHNFFRPGRLGTTGTAYPLLFFQTVSERLDNIDEVLLTLTSSQSIDLGRQTGGWSILSMGDLVTVEGTAWPLRALATVGGESVRNAVQTAERWLILNQNPTGGWGSTRENEPRTVLTTATLEALASVRPTSLDSITRGTDWLFRTQRPNGSWGMLPGDDGSVFHTALALRTLLSLGHQCNDPRLSIANHFLDENWHPSETPYIREMYDVHHRDGYTRLTLEHAVDAVIIEAVLMARSTWARGRITAALLNLTKTYRTIGLLHDPAVAPSIWNTIPPALAVRRFLDGVPMTGAASVYSYPDALVVSYSAARTGRMCLYQLAMRETAAYLRHRFLSVVSSAILIAVVVLVLRGSISTKEFLLAVAVPVALLVLDHLAADKKRMR